MTIRIAVIGGGYFATFHINAWLRLSGVELVAIVEQDKSKHAAIHKKLVHAGLDKTVVTNSLGTIKQQAIDLIDIATPPHTHAALISQALALNTPYVICQKPFCGNLKTAKEIHQKIQQTQSQVVVHENFRFQPWYRAIKSILNNNTLGDALYASFRLRPGDGQGPDAYLERQPYFRDMPQFLIHETGVHYIDVFRYLFSEPQALSAELTTLNPAIKGEDSGHFTFYYHNGLRTHFDGNRLLDHPADNTRLTMGEMLIEGTTGSLALHGNGDLLHRPFGHNNWQPMNYPFEDTDFGGDCVYLMQKHVVDHINKNTLLENDVGSYLKNLEIESLIYQSAREHRQLAVTPGSAI